MWPRGWAPNRGRVWGILNFQAKNENAGIYAFLLRNTLLVARNRDRGVLNRWRGVFTCVG